MYVMVGNVVGFVVCKVLVENLKWVVVCVLCFSLMIELINIKDLFGYFLFDFDLVVDILV